MQAFMADMPKHWLEERRNSDASQWDEMWNGVLHMPPMPNRMHQELAADLLAYFRQRWAKPSSCRAHQEVNLTTPEDVAHWTHNFRIPDMVLLDPPRFAIDKGEFMVGAPLVTIEIHSSGDEAYEKLDFYADLGVPEAWIIDRGLTFVEIRQLASNQKYKLLEADPDGWLRSPATGIEFRMTTPGKVTLRIRGDDTTAQELPDTP